MPLRAHIRRFAFRRVGGTAVVLVYHRVADLERDPQLLAVAPARFEEHVALLATRYRVVSLAEIADGLRRRSLPPRAVAVTFDDGYADNLTAAAPVLERRGVPATVFVSSGYVEAGREFWWDEVERLVLAPGSLPARLELTAGEGRFSATVDETREYTEPEARAAARWDVTRSDGGERQALYRDLCAFIRPLPPTDREAVLVQLRDAAGSERVVRDTHRPLTGHEVRELDAADGLRVGGHTCDHVLLAAQPDGEQRTQIVRDRERLSELLGQPPEMFSYPYGGLDAFTDETERLVSEAGYDAACANTPAVVKPWSGRFRVPRVLVRDVDARTLVAQLDGWFDEPR
jgi:peptidoglycan/xylan/chitin deacetylase (PgdA/CDA1 family)